jgi:hypothetical protein
MFIFTGELPENITRFLKTVRYSGVIRNSRFRHSGSQLYTTPQFLAIIASKSLLALRAGDVGAGGAHEHGRVLALSDAD